MSQMYMMEKRNIHNRCERMKTILILFYPVLISEASSIVSFEHIESEFDYEIVRTRKI
jgi:hypothetical protein